MCVTASNDIRHATSQHIQISELGVLCIGFDELGSKVAGAVLWAIVLLALIYGRLAEPKDVSYSGSLLDQVGQREEKPVPFGNNADERTDEILNVVAIIKEPEAFGELLMCLANTN